MSHNESTDTKEFTPITANQEEVKETGLLGKKGHATRNGHTISGGLQNWVWGFAVLLPAKPELEPPTKAVELIMSQPTFPPWAPRSPLPRLIGQIRRPRLPLIPRIVEIERPLSLSGFPLIIQSARDALACPLGWLLLGLLLEASV